jgi:glycosyltransferase involved in cell wall biosynthesis
MSHSKNLQIVYLSTFPPRACGIASFTSDLVATMEALFMPEIGSFIVAMLADADSTEGYEKNVRLFINENRPQEFLAAAQALNAMPEVGLINIQHEFGIFGQNWGINLMHFLEAIKKPLVVTFHTVLPEPDNELKQRVKDIAAKALNIVVMTDLSKKILLEQYGIPPHKIEVIPHGIHLLDYSLPAAHKSKVGVGDNSPVLSTFGLLSRSKGIEFVLQALPAVLKNHPDLKYFIIGATHPEVIKREGESYRQFLEEKVKSLRLEQNVIFHNRYLAVPQLFEFLQATDIYISPSLDPNQAVSGTLSYALGTGRPVVSTPFAQAKTLITPDVGVLVDFRDVPAMAKALNSLLNKPQELEKMGRVAYFNTRHMTWENVTLSYMHLFSKIVPELAVHNMHLPRIKLDHLIRLTDNNGILQFAKLSIGDPQSGYTLDDNARALLFAARYYQDTRDVNALRLVQIYLKFMEGALNSANNFFNYFNQYMAFDTASEKKDSQEDANARALRALMEVSGIVALPEEIRTRASALIEKRLSQGIEFKHPRAIAFYCIGLYHLYLQNKSAEILTEMDTYCAKLVELYRQNASADWQWFLKTLTYSNSILSEALLLHYQMTGNKESLKIGKKTLDFLLEQTYINGIYVPIGQNGWYAQGGTRAYFDQQPEEASAMVQTLMLAHKLTDEKKYYTNMNKAFYWFLGENLLGQFVYDNVTGGSYDGVGEKRVNLNQGAESTISYLLARLTMK